MPTDCQSIRNEFSLPHGGTAQSNRQPLALGADYVRVDERTFADWIVFARDYAQFVRYYNLGNTADGDWTPFWNNNPAIVLASLAAAPIDDFREASRQVFIELQRLDNQGNDLLLQQHLNLLFDLMTTLAWQLDRHIRLLPDALPVKESLRSRVNQALAPALVRWFSWQIEAAGNNLNLFPILDSGQSEIAPELAGLTILGSPIIPTTDFLNSPPANLQFTEDWLTGGATDWLTYVGSFTGNAVIFGDTTTMTNVSEPISFAIRHFFFTSVYEQFLQAFALAVREAESALRDLLYNWNQHEPHFALFLAFLRLLTKEQAYLNTLTDRHLRFYYERVLRLQPLAARPHHAHLVVTLAKQAATQFLPAGTLLKAGKDALGQEITFGLDEDFVANKAKVTELRSIFKAPNNPTLYRFGDPERTVYKPADRDRYFASPVSNSGDGLGESDLATEDGRWHPFGNRSVDETDNTWHIDMPRAEIGFAAASNYLYLTQGEREIELKFSGSGLSPLLGKYFKLALTTEEGWYETEVQVDQHPIDLRYRLRWTVPGDAPSILPYDAEIHGGHFNTPYPLLKAQLVHRDDADFAYQALKNLQIQFFDLLVVVTGKRDMALSGSTGPLDAGKPFHPFGAAPEDGAVFTLGDKEVFQKKSVINLNLSWKEENDYSGYYHAHTSGRHPKTIYRELRKGSWAVNTDLNILPDAAEDVDTAIVLGDDAIIAPDFSGNRPFSSTDTAGFLRFRLYGDWGHSNYPRSLAYYAKQGGSLPARLYDPQILDFSLDYTASQRITLNDASIHAVETAQFFHLHPFGEARRLPGSGAMRLLPLLVPQSSVSTPDGPVNNVGKDGGAWFVGVEGLEPPQELSLLVQVAPGTADPLLAKPERHVSWWYLSQNTWQPFAQGDVADGTRQLLQSGLIRFSVPVGANEDNTLLPAGKIWLRATVETAVDAVNQIVGVHAQGVSATQLMNNADPALGAAPLPAGAITKLRQPVGAVKKIEQPYTTFGFRAGEAAAAFYTRAGERLRHKQRAITIWDYERMLLQAFPQIHKVKCLNHLHFEPATPAPIYHELAPGHVTIIGVSDIHGRNGVDPLRPYLSLADLESMETLLRGLTSCFVRLHVRNPIFEPVLARFKVRLYDGLDETFYEKRLNEEIIQFLSPWAFPGGKDIVFGGKIYKSALVDFIEERSYVDFVEDFQLSHTLDVTQQNVEEVKPTKQVAILVSARRHDITIMEESPAAEWTESCRCDEDGGNQNANAVFINRQS